MKLIHKYNKDVSSEKSQKPKKKLTPSIFYPEVADLFEDWSKHLYASRIISDVRRTGNTGEISQFSILRHDNNEKKRVSCYGPLNVIDYSFQKKKQSNTK